MAAKEIRIDSQPDELPECSPEDTGHLKSDIIQGSADVSKTQADLEKIEDQAAVNYSTFTNREKAVVVTLVSMAGFFSPFSAFIYFPALDVIAQDLQVTIQLMNVTITVYLIIQGLVPSVFGGLSDDIGRRPIYLLVFAIYTLASIGLAIQHSYVALLVLRMLQSAGSSGTIALAYGVIADIAAPHERGGFVGIAHVGFNSAPSLGPVIGGVLADRAGWFWIFWLLAIWGAVVFGLLLLFLPETDRQLVGNGSRRTTGIYVPLYLHLTRNHAPHSNQECLMEKPRFRFPKIWLCLRLIAQKNTCIPLLSNAVFYMKYSCVQASLAPLLQRTYSLNTLQVGLCYLAFGGACAVASYGVGKITNYDYRHTARSHGLSIDRLKGDELNKFPIEKARLRTVWIYIFVSSASTLGYGWSIQVKTHLAVPLIMQFFVGLAVTGIFNVLNTLVVDLNPGQPATASASVSITRCLLAAGGISILQILFDAIGPGWTFTIIAALCFATAPFLWLERQRGWHWRSTETV